MSVLLKQLPAEKSYFDTAKRNASFYSFSLTRTSYTCALFSSLHHIENFECRHQTNTCKTNLFVGFVKMARIKTTVTHSLKKHSSKRSSVLTFLYYILHLYIIIRTYTHKTICCYRWSMKLYTYIYIHVHVCV